MKRKITFKHQGLRSPEHKNEPWYRIVSSPCLQKGVAYPMWSMFVDKETYDSLTIGTEIDVSLFYTKVA